MLLFGSTIAFFHYVACNNPFATRWTTGTPGCYVEPEKTNSDKKTRRFSPASFISPFEVSYTYPMDDISNGKYISKDNNAVYVKLSEVRLYVCFQKFV